LHNFPSLSAAARCSLKPEMPTPKWRCEGELESTPKLTTSIRYGTLCSILMDYKNGADIRLMQVSTRFNRSIPALERLHCDRG